MGRKSNFTEEQIVRALARRECSMVVGGTAISKEHSSAGRCSCRNSGNGSFDPFLNKH